jgi:hypothetical protein
MRWDFGVLLPAMKRAILVAAVVLSAARCATMVNETTEKIPVRSTPAGAVVSVDCGNAPLYGGVTPTTITVPRTASPCSITLAKEGYVATRIDFQRQVSGAASANKVVAAPVGAAAALLGFLVADHISGLNPDAIAGSIYSATTAAAAAPANAFDARKGGAYKQVPGEVEVTLDPEPTTPSPPR